MFDWTCAITGKICDKERVHEWNGSSRAPCDVCEVKAAWSDEVLRTCPFCHRETQGHDYLNTVCGGCNSKYYVSWSSKSKEEGFWLNRATGEKINNRR